jgi:phosphoribosylformylglycinamidine synthase
MRHGDLQVASASGPGNKVILFGSTTGPDGVGGASVLASAAFDRAGAEAAKRPSVQVGDPFLEKLLVECCLELYAAGLVVGIQDLGAAGVACATTELAAAGTGGMVIRLDEVPLRDASLGPPEILMSESQERMMAVVAPGHVAEFLAVCAKWDVRAAVIGEVTDGDRLVMTWHGDTVVDIPPSSAAEGPVYARPARRGAGQDALAARDPAALPRPADGAALRAALLALIASPGLADKSWVTDQYDRYVRGDTVLAMPEDGGLLRVDEATGLGIALATDGNGRYCRLDPYLGTQLVLSEAYRNVAVTGARPLAVTNCLNFGSPEDPEVMWQFAEAVRGLADGCAALGVPVTGGNVSFYNQTGTAAIHPTPVIGVLGVHDDVRRRLAVGFPPGAAIVLLGETEAEFGGSAWAHVVHEHLGGRPPAPRLDAERRLAGLLAAAAASGLVLAAHDLSDGGLAVALAESCLRGGTGCRVRLPGDPFTWLFSESAARAIVAVAPGAAAGFAELCAAHGVPATDLGVADGDGLVIEGWFSAGLAELAAAHAGTLPALFA